MQDEVDSLSGCEHKTLGGRGHNIRAVKSNQGDAVASGSLDLQTPGGSTCQYV